MEKINLLLLNIIGFLGIYLAPVKDIMIAVSILVVLDFITGIMSARKKKIKITSRRFRQTISKTFVYQSTVIVAMVLEKYLMPGIPAIKVVSTLIAITEIKSFFENVEILTGIDFWGKLTSKVTAILKQGEKK